MTVSGQLLDLARRIRRSLRMDRNGEPFFIEQDEIAHDLEILARRAEGASHETISLRSDA